MGNIEHVGSHDMNRDVLFWLPTNHILSKVFLILQQLPTNHLLSKVFSILQQYVIQSNISCL